VNTRWDQMTLKRYGDIKEGEDYYLVSGKVW